MFVDDSKLRLFILTVFIGFNETESKIKHLCLFSRKSFSEIFIDIDCWTNAEKEDNCNRENPEENPSGEVDQRKYFGEFLI